MYKITNCLLIIVSVFITTIFSELCVRIVLPKVNYLQPYLYSDYRLNYVIKPYSAGHDKLGFRNTFIPKQVDIVTIGDSQTYGVSATMDNSWPALLQEKINKTIYNMSVCGYGPVQYYYLLKQIAFSLKPKFIIVGFYLGNDLCDTYDLIYNYQYWDNLKDKTIPYENKHLIGEKSVIEDYRNPNVKFSILRSWLAHNSVLYRILINSSFGENFRWKENLSMNDFGKKIIFLIDNEHNIKTAFWYKGWLECLDITNPMINEGLLKSLLLFKMMHQLCAKENIKLLVVVIPTKESVYSKYIKVQSNEGYDMIRKQIKYEAIITKIIREQFSSDNIDCFELLPAMQTHIGGPQLYPASTDGHPNKYGYGVMAGAIANYISNASNR